MKKIKINDFIKDFSANAAGDLKDKFFTDNLEIKSYLPFITKNVIAAKIADISTYEFEDYVDENGEIQRRKTGKINVNSSVQYLLFCRSVIENYTNLEIETEGFYEEYDALNQTGALEKIMQAIPEKELSELKSLVDMKQKDVLFNEPSPQAFVSNQIEKIAALGASVLRPYADKALSAIANIDEEKLSKIEKLLDKSIKRLK